MSQVDLKTDLDELVIQQKKKKKTCTYKSIIVLLLHDILSEGWGSLKAETKLGIFVR